MAAMIVHSDVFDNVEQFQFFQEKEGEVILRVIKGRTYTERDSDRIRKEMLKRLGSDVRLELNFVDHIPRSQIGKFTFIVQKLSVDIASA